MSRLMIAPCPIFLEEKSNRELALAFLHHAKLIRNTFRSPLNQAFVVFGEKDSYLVVLQMAGQDDKLVGWQFLGDFVSATGAKKLLMVTEAWVKTVNENEDVALDRPASAYPDRQDAFVVQITDIQQKRSVSAMQNISILHDDTVEFQGETTFLENEGLMAGRFYDIVFSNRQPSDSFLRLYEDIVAKVRNNEPVFVRLCPTEEPPNVH